MQQLTRLFYKRCEHFTRLPLLSFIVLHVDINQHLYTRRFEEIYRPRQPAAGSSSGTVPSLTFTREFSALFLFPDCLAPPPVEGTLHPLRVSIEVPAIEILLAPAHTSPLAAAEIDARFLFLRITRSSVVYSCTIFLYSNIPLLTLVYLLVPS